MAARPQPPAHMPTNTQRRHGNDPSPIIFLIGLFALLASHAIWPGILLLLGLTNLVHEGAQGRSDRGVRALLWLGGLTLLFATGTFWPGILILLFINMAINGGRSRHWHW
jgi:hypothetical protein